MDIGGCLKISGAYFENPLEHALHARQGDILYSDGEMLIDSVRLLVKAATNGLSIFRHSGDHWSLDITNVRVDCPTG